MKLTGSEIVIECLKEQGVDTVFGYPGCIACQIAGRDLRLPRLPFASSLVQYLITDIQLQTAVRNIDLDDIAFFYQRDWTADCCFRRNVADRCATGCTAEP